MDTHGTTLYNLWQKKRRLRLWLIATTVPCIIIFSWLSSHIFPTSPVITSQNTSTPASSSTGSVLKENPTYTTITPVGKTVEWTRLNPPNSESFYAYVDTIYGASIRVSEQRLPNSLQANTDDQIAELAKNYNANRTISVGATTVYIGTSVKGQQSLIFSEHSLLIMITSNSVLNDRQWSDYIASLQ